MTMPDVKTNPMQHYLENELVERLGLVDEEFLEKMALESAKYISDTITPGGEADGGGN